MTQRKTAKRKATPRQKKAARLLVENVSLDKPKPVGDILRKAGYSEGSAIKPSRVIDSDSFQSILEAGGVTDDKLVKTLSEGLEATKTIGLGTKPEADHPTRHKFLETGLRLKGHGKDVGNFNFNFINISRDKYR